MHHNIYSYIKYIYIYHILLLKKKKIGIITSYKKINKLNLYHEY